MASKQFSLEPEEVFHESSESFQEESSSSSLNDDVQQSLKEVAVPSSNSKSISNNMIPNVHEASTSHNVFNERLEEAYFDASTSFHDSSNVHTFYQPYPHEKKWTKDHPLHKIIGDPKLSVRTMGQLANYCLFLYLLSSIEHANVAEALRDTDWVSAMKEELDQFARLKVWRLVPQPEGKTIIKTKWIFKNKKDESSLEEVYVGQPLAFVNKQYPDHVYALDKALYGLKQAPWTKDHPLYKIIGDLKSSVRTRGQLANSCLFSYLLSSIEPANVAEALRDTDWVSAMQEELDQFARLKVWRLVPRPEGKTIIKTKWIFKNKTDESIDRIEATRLFLAYASHKDFIVFQMDVKTTFLNGILKEELYVGQPLGFVSKQYPDHVYALDKALYGLKEAPWAWYDVLS
uniref:Reverse transcriptase Ty1/copia-type domain-containing protein n=1 Tax=Tanacetum cinerariifolium TaxID=118510 RepID=A0A6L2J2I9_TANCI|nr:hypothetical protein [Tanacetum cinerariifolium]